MVLLPLENTSCEDMAEFFLEKLLQGLSQDLLAENRVHRVKVGISEATGQQGAVSVSL